jgi:2-dehydro-3-deoxyphosphogluconate aldolase/(4S)-4-hydroxy-2-oxoglutarate aldolase
MKIDNLKQFLSEKGVIAVLEIEDEADAVPVCRALLEGGISAIELALRTPAALPSIRRIARDVPEMCIGAGTVIQRGQAAAVWESGGSFGLAPGCTPFILAEAAQVGLPFIPGISTATDIETAVEYGKNIQVLKFFPAVPQGGVPYLTAINGPYKHLGLSYLPLGGVSTDNLEQWAGLEAVCAVGGTWIAKREQIKAHKWDDISRRAEEAQRLWRQYRG